MPNRPALWSEQTWDEMYNAWTEITYDAETDPNLNTADYRKAQQEASRNNPITTVLGCVAPTNSPLVWRMTNAAKLAPLPPKENQSRPEAGGAADNGGGGPRINHNVTKDEKEAAAKQAVGAESFELVGVADFIAPEQALKISTRSALYPVERVKDRKSTRLNSSHIQKSRMPSSA